MFVIKFHRTTHSTVVGKCAAAAALLKAVFKSLNCVKLLTFIGQVKGNERKGREEGDGKGKGKGHL